MNAESITAIIMGVMLTTLFTTLLCFKLKEEKVKVTISLSKSSLHFFKTQADRYHTAYQRMIRNLLDAYALQHMK